MEWVIPIMDDEFEYIFESNVIIRTHPTMQPIKLLIAITLLLYSINGAEVWVKSSNPTASATTDL